MLKYGTTTVWGKPFSLTIQAGSNSTVSVNRTSSPNQHANTGAITSGGIVYYGDTLTITATPASGYKLTKFTINGTEYASGQTSEVWQTITVTSAVSVITSSSAGGWHTVWTGTKTVSFSASESFNQTYKAAGISIANFPTRITGTIYPQTANAHFPTTSYSAEELDTSSSRIAVNVETVGSGNRRTEYWEELYAYRTTSAIMLMSDMYTYHPSAQRKLCVASTVKITKVEQFY